MSRRAIIKRKRECLERARVELGARILRAHRDHGIPSPIVEELRQALEGNEWALLAATCSHYRDVLEESDTARAALMHVAELAELVDFEF